MLFTNGKIYTAAGQPFANCLITKGNKIVYVGSLDSAAALAGKA